MKQRQTRQLRAVLDVVVSAQDHPTADEVLRRVRSQLPRISLGTVYRNLQKLALQGRVRMVYLPDQAARYDGMTGPHDHFFCERCAAVTDLMRPRASVPAVGARLGRSGYVVRTHSLTLYGVCPGCSTPQAGRAAVRARGAANA
jgi:Fur family peroxide stress response transcriptional regulator